MKKRPIPAIPSTVDRELRSFLDPLKENVEVAIGLRGTTIKPLTGSPTLEEVAKKLNEIIARIG